MASESPPSEKPETDQELVESASGPEEDATASKGAGTGADAQALEGGPSRKTKKKRRAASAKDDAGGSVDQAGSGGREEAGEDAGKVAEGRRRRERRNNWIFAGLIVSAILVELWLFGKNGQIRVCVGREGVTDFNLIGARRTDENRPKVPYCDTRYNIGLTGDLERRTEETLYLACRKATILTGEQERAMCFGSMADWKKHVTVRQVLPWEPEFTRRMFWFLD